MAERPVGARQEGGAPLGESSTTEANAGAGNGAVRSEEVANPMAYPLVFLPLRPRAEVVIKADLLPAVSVLSLVPLLGLGVGWLWSRLAPPQRVRIFPEGEQVPLLVESYHRFDDLVLFALLCLGAGVATGVGVWFLRERRGPVIMLAAVLGSALGAWLAMRVGLSWAEARYAVTEVPALGDVLPVAPRLESGWGILAWPLTTALTYGVLAAWNGMDDLGRRLG